MASPTYAQRPPRAAALPAWPLPPLLLAAGLAALLPAVAATQQPSGAGHPDHGHDGHHPPAAAKPAAPTARADSTRRSPASGFGGWQARRAGATPAAGVQRAEQAGLRLDFTLAVGRTRAAAAVAGRDATIRLRLADVRSGQARPGVELAGWIDRRATLETTPADACKAKVNNFVQSGMTMEGAIRARAVEDLNSYFVLTLNETPDIAVLDPFLGFGRTKLYTTVPLRSPGVDWVLSGDGRRLFVSMPAARQVAVVDVETWKVLTNVDVGGAPGRVELAPDGRQLWVVDGRTTGANARDSITVVDAATLRVAGRVPVGGGSHAIAFDEARGVAFVTNGASGTVTLVDLLRLAPLETVAVGPRPVSVAYASAANAAYVVTEGDGALVAVDPVKRAVVARIPMTAGVRAVSVAPALTKGHGGHGGHAGHGAQQAGAAGRWVFVTNPADKVVRIVDAARHQVLRTLQYEHTPDQVGFTTSFAYVRFADSPKLSMISLDDPTTGGFGAHDVFEAGQRAPGDASGELASSVVPAPDMPDALYALNANEKMVYYYHYMEGMPIPSGGLTTYTYQPRAVLVAGKALRETAPGEYAATVRVDEPGEYELVLLVPSPRVIQCFPITVRADAAKSPARPALAVRPRGAGALRTRGDTLRFDLVDDATGRRASGLRDVNLLVVSTAGWQHRTVARPRADGSYEAPLALPASGPYYVSVAVPSLRVSYNDRRPAVLRAAAARNPGGGA